MNIKFCFLTSLIILTHSCATSPTGRKQLNIVGDEQMAAMGRQSFASLKKEGKISHHSHYNQLTKCLSYDLLKAANQNPNEWEVVVFDDNSANAFALPGNKIGVHTGMIKLAENSDQLAAVIGHEIGHVLANHGNERVSQAMVAQGGILAAGLALGEESKKNGLLIGAIGLGTQFGILMPFSRKHEKEADLLGVEYMAKAGYHPKEASKLWVVMAKNSSGAPPEFLSTHPAANSRVKYLFDYAENWMKVYDENRSRRKCH